MILFLGEIINLVTQVNESVILKRKMGSLTYCCAVRAMYQA